MGQVCKESDIKEGSITQIKALSQQDSFEAVTTPSDINRAEDSFQDFKGSSNFDYLSNTHNLQWVRHKYREEYYLGDWQDGEMKGKGYIVVPNKYAYCGDFERKPHGRGKAIFYDKNITFEGEMNQGAIQGQGVLTQNQGLFDFNGTIYNSKPKQGTLRRYHPQTKQLLCTIFIDDYPQQKATIDYADEKHYEGSINFKTFLPEGYGLMAYPNQNRYEGNWEAGHFHGYGTYTWSDGSEYAGEYVRDVKHGRGRFTYKNKKSYNGDWVEGKQHGEGTMYNENGEAVQRGVWRNGQLSEQTTDTL